jgi:multidrug efflux pump
MILSDTSIKRPVLATVMSLVLVLFGLFGYQRLSVRQLPDVDAPIISITTVYRGASAAIIEGQVTQVIEDAIAGIEGVNTITSTSQEESSRVSIEFSLDREMDSAANDVRDRVSRAVRQLPVEADAPRIAKSDSDARAVMWVALTSDRLSGTELTDYADRFLVDRLSIVKGVASVRIGGGRRYAIRIWLDKNALAARELTVQDVETALRRQNILLPSGRIESVQREVAVRTDSSLRTVEDFEKVVVRESGGYFVRLGEVAEIELGAENNRSDLRVFGRSAVGLGIVKQSKSNTLAVANGIKAEMELLRDSLPQGVGIEVAYDQSVFIGRAIYEVFIAISIALAMVIAVNFIFLRSLRATLIPAVAIPVSVIGSLSVLAALGYSINILTLLAVVLAIGLVVDDAIVVLENIHRRIEEGEDPLLASVRGTRQIAFAVIATTVVLVAVFVPISFMQGSIGRMFGEFGITVATAVLFSSFVALTLTPMMCSKLLVPVAEESYFFRITNRFFDGMHSLYRWLLVRMLGMPLVVLAVGLVVSVSAYGLWAFIPKENAPVEDRGSIFIPVTAPDSASLDYTRRYVAQIENAIQPVIDRGDAWSMLTIIAPSFGRPGPVNKAFIILRLVPWDKREIKQSAVVREIFPKILGVPGVRAFAVSPASIGRGRWGAKVQMVIGGPDYKTLTKWRDDFLNHARGIRGLINVNSNFTETRPELFVDIDRDRAADLNVQVEEIGRTLETLLGSRYVTTYEQNGKLYNVILQARASERSSQRDLSNIYVRSTGSRQLVPLSNLVKFREGGGARELKRTDRMRTITITASLAPGFTQGQAVDALKAMTGEVLPQSARITWAGGSREFLESSGSLYLAFALALLIVFLALAAQFESFVHPFIIMLSVPLAMTGGMGALLYAGVSLNIYSQIGLIMLIGLTAKNAILIVEFANQLRDKGNDILTSVTEASVNRLRPILMTSIATAFGAMPLALADGAGAEARRSLGVVVVGGVSFSTVLSLLVVPVLYLLLARFAKPAGYIERKLNQMEADDSQASADPASSATPAE